MKSGAKLLAAIGFLEKRGVKADVMNKGVGGTRDLTGPTLMHETVAAKLPAVLKKGFRRNLAWSSYRGKGVKWSML